MKEYIVSFNALSLTDIGQVGGKNAALGELCGQLSSLGIRIPAGFAVTTQGFEEFLKTNNLQEALQELMESLDRVRYGNLREIGEMARNILRQGKLPANLVIAIKAAYRSLCDHPSMPVAVRSSATAEDLPQASFAGQHDSFLNIRGEDQVIDAVHRCFVSLYTDRAIKYREDNNFQHEKVLLSVGIQKMVRSDKACSGVSFTLEPESGFRDLILISGVWGLGENMVQGTVNPDEFFVFKPTLKLGKHAIIQKKLGDKLQTMIYEENSAESGTINIDTAPEKQRQFVLTDAEVLSLANWCLQIERHFGKPMDIEWAKDGETGELFILQARPETVQAAKNPYLVREFKLLEKGKILCQGSAIGSQACTGIARILSSPEEAGSLQKGDIIISDMITPDWDPLLKNAGGIITNKGGRTSHASIVARELGVPAIVGCGNATENIEDGAVITLSCCEGKTGFVYEGNVKIKETNIDFSLIRKPADTQVMLITGDPDQAFKLSFYPNDGVGLLRMEFIINHSIRVHPMALYHFAELKDEALIQKIDVATNNAPNKRNYFIDQLSQGIASIAAAFYPKDVIVRMSDFKTNEYANLLGGEHFEPSEENPMIGFRGASRYYHPAYENGFRMECEAVKRVRETMGLWNVKLMIPFCRTLEEGKRVLEVMQSAGLDRSKDSALQIYMMVEIPSNVILAEEFAEDFDGFSIGSNDLTQLVLGVDRDSELVSGLFNEQNPAVKEMITSVIRKAHKAGIPIGLCGQAPSDFPAFAQFLVEHNIDSISFNPDALLQGIENIRATESMFLEAGPEIEKLITR